MPTVVIVDGVRIVIYPDDHGRPHFHVTHAEYEAQVSLDGTLLEGSLPPRILAMVREWAELNQDGLLAAWEECSNGRVPRRIRPLA